MAGNSITIKEAMQILKENGFYLHRASNHYIYIKDEKVVSLPANAKYMNKRRLMQKIKNSGCYSLRKKV